MNRREKEGVKERVFVNAYKCDKVCLTGSARLQEGSWMNRGNNNHNNHSSSITTLIQIALS